MSETNEYKEWLSSAPTSVAMVETLQVSHSSWTDIYIANWDEGFTGTLEDGSSQAQYVPGRFFFEPNEVSDNLEQATSIVISSLEGSIYRSLKAMTPTERLEPIKITHRLYFHNDYSQVLVNPPPVWTLHLVEASHDVIKAEIRSTPLRIQRLGVYYTQSEFPVLVYAT